MPAGQPTKYTQELADAICEELALGNSLRTVCEIEGMPSVKTIFNWFRTYPEFLQQYARATEERAEAQNEEILDIGQDAIKAVLEYKGEPKLGNALVSAHKLKADTLKWSMSKMKPKKYGDKIDMTSGGEKITTNTIVFKDFTNDSTGK